MCSGCGRAYIDELLAAGRIVLGVGPVRVLELDGVECSLLVHLLDLPVSQQPLDEVTQLHAEQTTSHLRQCVVCKDTTRLSIHQIYTLRQKSFIVFQIMVHCPVLGYFN